jgi:hypothetical protein
MEGLRSETLGPARPPVLVACAAAGGGRGSAHSGLRHPPRRPSPALPAAPLGATPRGAHRRAKGWELQLGTVPPKPSRSQHGREHGVELGLRGRQLRGRGVLVLLAERQVEVLHLGGGR